MISLNSHEIRRTTTIILIGAALSVAAPALADSFSGGYSLDQWTLSGIQDGASTIAGQADTLRFTYDNSPGPVDPWEGAYETIAAADGMIGLDWEWTGFHAWHQSFGGLQLFADGPDGMNIVDLVAYHDTPASFAFSGTTALQIHAGYAFGFIVSGENGDSAVDFNGALLMKNVTVLGAETMNGLGESYGADAWTMSDSGSATMTIEAPLDLPTDRATLCYDVDLGTSLGVSYRESSYEVVAPDDATIEFDWRYSGIHAWSESFGTLRLDIDGPDGMESIELLPLTDVGAPFEYSGTVEFAVHGGYPFRLVAGGSNDDFNSFINGCIEISHFDVDLQMPDSCPADTDESGMVDFADLLQVLSAWGPCPGR